MTPDVEAATDGFAATFDRAAEGVWASPGRVNLIGEHTDHQHGLALPAAIDRYALVAAAARTDGVVRVASAQQPGDPVQVSWGERPPTGSWSAYPLGVAWAMADQGMGETGADLWVDSTVPSGSGLSSSAALTCATALTLLDLAGRSLPRPQVAGLAQRAETEVVGAPVGLLDQMAVLVAEPGSAQLLDFSPGLDGEPPTHRSVPLPDPPYRLLVVDTGVHHSHAAGQYAQLRERLEAARSSLDIRSLSELDEPDLPRLNRLDARGRAAVRHVVTENARVRECVAALERSDVASVGALMTASHRSLRDDLQVSCPELDLVVETALSAGAPGARMTGGGFGGCAVVLADAAVADALSDQLAAAFDAASLHRPVLLPVTPVGAADRLA